MSFVETRPPHDDRAPDDRALNDRALDDNPYEAPRSIPSTASPSSRRRTLAAVAGRSLGLISTFLVNAVIARLLLDFGDFQLLLTLLLPASWLAVAGLHAAAVRVLGETQATVGNAATISLARQLLSIAAIFGMLAVPVMFLLLFLGSYIGIPVPQHIGIVTLFAVAIGCIAYQQVVAEVFNGLHEVRITALFTGGMMGGPLTTFLFVLLIVTWSILTTTAGDNIATFSFVVAGVTHTVRKLSLFEATAVLAIALGVTMPASWYWLRTILFRRSESTAAAPVAIFSRGALLRLAFSLLGLQLTVYLATLADVWIAGRFFRDASGAALPQLDWYIAARRVTMLGLVPLQLAGTLISPRAATLFFAGDKSELQRVLQRYALWGALPCLGLCAVLIVAPEWLLSVYLGPRFADAATVVRIMAIGTALAACSGHAGYALAVTGFQRSAFVVNVMAGLLVVLAGYPAAVYGGAVGLATVSSLAMLVKYGGEWWLARRSLGVWTHLG